MKRQIRVRLRAFCILILATALQCFAQEPSWQRLINSDKEPQNWLSYGGNYSAHRYSSLNQINAANVKNLAPVWMFPTGEVRGGLNATPIVMDGVMCLMGADESRLCHQRRDRVESAVLGLRQSVGAGLSGSPISYSVNGRQYVAIPTGMGSLLSGVNAILWPEKAGKLPEGASTLVVFALPESKGGAVNGK